MISPRGRLLLAAASAALAALPAGGAMAAGIDGAMTEEQLNERVWEYYKSMGGVDPREKWKEFVEDSITPAELKELQEYKESVEQFLRTADQVLRGEFRPDAGAMLRQAYADLLKNKKIPRKLRRELPTPAMLGRFLATVTFALDMRKAAVANAVAVQAEVVFQALSQDTELGARDEPLAAGSDAALKVYNKYWLSGRHQSKLESILRHQGYLTMRFREEDNKGCKTTPSHVSRTAFGGTVTQDELCTYDANVVDGLVRLLTLAAEYKKAAVEFDRAQTELRELDHGYERWRHVAGSDFEALRGLMETEQKVEAAIPRYEKLAAEAPQALAAARASLKGDMIAAAEFCNTAAPALRGAKVGLRDFAGRVQSVRLKAEPLLAKVSAAEKDAARFCDEYSALSREAAERRRREEDQEYERYRASIQNACGAGGIAGMRYTGPTQSDVNNLAARAEAALKKSAGRTSAPNFSFAALDRDYVYDETGALPPELDALERSLRDQIPDSPPPPEDSVGGVYLKGFALFKEYWRARTKFAVSINNALATIRAESEKQRARCEAMQEDARRSGKPSPDCLVCDTGPADRAATRAHSQAPALKFSAISQPAARWDRLQEAAGAIASRAETGFFEQASAAQSLLAAGPGTGDAAAPNPETVRAQYERVFSEMQGAWGFADAAAALRGHGRALAEWHRAQADELARAKAEAPRALQEAQRMLAAAEEDLRRLAEAAAAAERNYGAAAEFFAQSPWPERAKEYSERAREVTERLQAFKDAVAARRKASGDSAAGLAASAKALDDLEWHAAAFLASASKLEKLGRELDEDRALRQLRTLAGGGAQPQYLHGVDAARLQAVQARLGSALSGMGEVERRCAASAAAELRKMLELARKLKPVPDDAILLDDGSKQSLLRAAAYRDLEARARKVNLADMRAAGELARLRGEIAGVYSFSDHEKAEYAEHPVYKAYLAALAACDELEGKAAAAQAGLVSRLKAERDALARDLAALSGKPLDATPAALSALDRRIQALVRDWRERLSGKERDESGLGDLQQLEADLSRLREAAAQAGEEKRQEEARKALAALVPRMERAAPAQAGSILEEAGRIADQARIGGEPATQEVMARLAELARAKGAGPAGGPPQAGGPPGASEREGESSAALRDAMDDLRDLLRDLEALPGGPDSAARIDELVERGRGAVERAREKMAPDASGRPDPNRRPLDDEFARLEKAAQLKKTAQARRSGPDPAAIESIRELYRKFAAAFAAKDLAGVLDCLAEDWESSEGVGLADMERTLGNAFQAFDTVAMEIQNLQIRQAGQGFYQATYSSLMTGLIRQNDIRHEEKSTHSDTIALTGRGPRIQRTSGGTAWVQ